MNNLVSKRTKKFISKRNRRKRWLSIVTALACVVVFCTTYALILPAITMERETFCRHDEHEHTAECYSPVKVCGYEGAEEDRVLICGLTEGEMPADALICGLEETVHEHTDECYDISREFTCTLNEHTHTDGCFESRAVSVCTKEEHVHSEDCYAEDGSLLCELEEHTHGEDCFQTELVLICEEEEHTHSEDCYTVTKTLLCTETGHTHTAACYAEGTLGHVHTEDCYHVHTEDCYEEKLCCEIPVHIHSLQCYSNPALVESQAHWEQSIDAVTLSGNWAEDLVKIAGTQLNYKESTENYEVQADGTTVKGYTRFGDWFGAPYSDWNAMFVAFCLNYAGIGRGSVPYAQSASEWAVNLRLNNTFKTAADGYAPAAGDLVFFDYDQDETIDAMGIVTDTDTEKINTIEGDINGEVVTASYTAGNAMIAGYGALPLNPIPRETAKDDPSEESTSEESTSEENISEIHFTNADGVTVTVTGNLPEGAAIVLSEVPEETLAAILAELGSDAPFFAYDITVVDAEGNEWQPDELGACVTLTGLTIPGGAVEIVHIPDEGAPEYINASSSESGIEFDVAGFSIYLGFTVDFNYDGVLFSISGYTKITLSELFARLNIPVSTSEIADVSFSDSELVRVDKIENDWLLTSLAPFSTEEKLTVSHLDGRIMTIFVTDAQSDSLASEGDTVVNVSFDWLDPSVASSVVVTLYKNGVTTGETRTLNRANNWTASFTGLPAGEYSIEYTQSSDLVYFLSGSSSVKKGWYTAASLQSGKRYVFTQSVRIDRRTYRYALQNTSGSTLSRSQVTVNSDATISSLTTAMQWTYDGLALTNVNTGNTLHLTSSAASTASNRADTILFENGHLRRPLDDGDRYLSYTNGAYAVTTDASDAVTFTAYSYENSTTITFSVSVEKGLEEKSPDIRKYIDSFRDSKDNPDTDLDDKARAGLVSDDIYDLYRLYLDIGPESTHKAIDVLFIIDSSTSMSNFIDGYDAIDINGNPSWRCWALDTLINGEAPGTVSPGSSYMGDNEHQHQTSLEANGMISKIAAMNPQNKIAVARFSGTSEILMPWTTSANVYPITYTNVSGTNYVAGLQNALTLLEQVKDDGNEKFMIFISDGPPTKYYESLSSNVLKGSGSERPEESAATAIVIDEFKNTDTVSSLVNSGMLSIYSILVGTWDPALMEQLSTNNTSYSSTNFQRILRQIDGILTSNVGHYADLKLTDTLSDYVDFYTNDLDFRIDKIDVNSSGAEIASTPLYLNGNLTTAGKEYIKPGGVSINNATKTVTVDFLDNYEAEGNVIFRTSFNVKTTQKAYRDFETNRQTSSRGAYDGKTGDPGTDYPNNLTSGDKPGFYSNSSAVLYYSQVLSGYPDINGQKEFPRPVIQVDLDPPPVTPTETVFEHNKKIDFLGDGGSNPDTRLNGQDFYRLYLDIRGKQEPIDLLIVVDSSSSMDTNHDMTIGDLTGQSRDDAVMAFLNGTLEQGALNDAGFLSFFLNLNEENKVAVTSFFGPRADYKEDNNRISADLRSYTQDSKIVLDWTTLSSFTRRTFADCSAPSNNGTNYEAGLKRAAEMFAMSDIRSDGHRKIMLFLSDGVPSYFLIDNNDVGTVCNEYTLKSSDVGHRWGNGSYSSNSNYPFCKQTSIRAFDDFQAANPDVIVYAIGVSNDINASSPGTSQSPDVLRYMAENGNGQYLSVEKSMSELQLQIRSLFYPNEVVITDNLSRYVRYYGSQPDVLVTMTNEDTGEVITLYQNGAVTTDGRGILSKVVYTANDISDTPRDSTGTVTAVFDPDYSLLPDWVYTLSFNVETTQTAYNRYEASGYNAKGDAKTDYGTNTTSSNQDGFYSNSSANVSFTVSGKEFTEPYSMPVIQVNVLESLTLTIHKTVSGATTDASFPFELTVCDSSGQAIDLTDLDLPTGVTLKSKDGVKCIIAFSLKDGDTLTLTKLIPKDAKLTLNETAHDGYSVTMSVGTLGNFIGDSRSFDMGDDLAVTVTNTAGTQLPSTGGSGTLLFTLGGLLIISAACVYIMLAEKRRWERRIN